MNSAPAATSVPKDYTVQDSVHHHTQTNLVVNGKRIVVEEQEEISSY